MKRQQALYQRRGARATNCRLLRLTLATGMVSGLALLGGCASLDAAAADDAINAVYRCDNGQQISARYLPPNTAEVAIDGRTIDMHIARSASGARYVGGGDLVWWTKGSGPGSTGSLVYCGSRYRLRRRANHVLRANAGIATDHFVPDPGADQ